MAFKTLHDRVFIRQTEARAETSSGLLLIPDQAQKKPPEGEVVAIGQGRMLEDGTVIPLQVNVGDRVFFYGGQEIEIEDEKLLMLREGEIIAILPPKKNGKHAGRK